MQHDNDTPAIIAKLIVDSKRVEALPKHFGHHLLTVETYIYQYMSELAPAYRGGHWHFYELSNGGFYMAPDGEAVRLVVLGNGFEGLLSADGAGITVCLFAFSHLSFRYPDEERFASHFHALRQFARSHAEQASIFAAID